MSRFLSGVLSALVIAGAVPAFADNDFEHDEEVMFDVTQAASTASTRDYACAQAEDLACEKADLKCSEADSTSRLSTIRFTSRTKVYSTSNQNWTCTVTASYTCY